MFPLEDRCHILFEAICKEIDHGDKLVTVQAWEGWTWEFIRDNEIPVVIRGVRNDTDLHHEENLEQVIRDMTSAQVIYMRPDALHYQTSSTLARAYIKSNAFDVLEKYLSRSTIELIIHKNSRKEETK